MYVDRSGSNLTKAAVVEYLQRAVGATADVLDYLPVGGIYQNGGIWFQRIS
jgi:hypothetical protein